MLGAAGVVHGFVGCLVGVIVGCLVTLLGFLFPIRPFSISLDSLWSVLEGKIGWIGREYMGILGRIVILQREP